MKNRIKSWFRLNGLVAIVLIVTFSLLGGLGVARALSLRSVVDISSLNPLITSEGSRLQASKDSRELAKATVTDPTKTDTPSTPKSDKPKSSSTQTSNPGATSTGGSGASTTNQQQATPKPPASNTPAVNPNANPRFDTVTFSKVKSMDAGYCKITYTLNALFNPGGATGHLSAVQTLYVYRDGNLQTSQTAQEFNKDITNPNETFYVSATFGSQYATFYQYKYTVTGTFAGRALSIDYTPDNSCSDT